MPMRIRTLLVPAASLAIAAGVAGCQGSTQIATADRYGDNGVSRSAGNPPDSTIPNTALGARNNQGTVALSDANDPRRPHHAQ